MRGFVLGTGDPHQFRCVTIETLGAPFSASFMLLSLLCRLVKYFQWDGLSGLIMSSAIDSFFEVDEESGCFSLAAELDYVVVTTRS